MGINHLIGYILGIYHQAAMDDGKITIIHRWKIPRFLQANPEGRRPRKPTYIMRSSC